MTLEDLATWGELCAWALARGHARSGQPATIAGYLGTDNAFEHAMASFAEAYADQTERDHAALLAAIKTGRVDGRERRLTLVGQSAGRRTARLVGRADAPAPDQPCVSRRRRCRRRPAPLPSSLRRSRHRPRRS